MFVEFSIFSIEIFEFIQIDRDGAANTVPLGTQPTNCNFVIAQLVSYKISTLIPDIVLRLQEMRHGLMTF
jgi:hypothetical protein